MELIEQFKTDTLRYKLQAVRSLTQDTAKVAVDVSILSRTDQLDPQRIQEDVRAALKGFVDTEWTFATVRKLGETVGYEKISIAAYARVPVSETYNLEERGRRASREGLSIGKPTVDYSLPVDQIDSIVQELRMTILERAAADAAAFSKKTSRTWRLGDVLFGIEGEDSWDLRSSKGAYRAPNGDALLVDAGVGLAGSERVKLIASVTLRAEYDVSAKSNLPTTTRLPRP